MALDFLPSSDFALLAWGNNYSSLITLDPVAVGLDAPTAVTLAGKLSAFDAALSAATNPATRGGATVLAKDQSRADLVAYCRLTARAIQGCMTVTNTQRYDLGLTVRDASPSPVPPPAAAPDIDVLGVSGNTVQIRLHDPANPTRRGKPAGVAGMAIFTFIGATPPEAESQWTYQGNWTRTQAEVTFPEGTPAGSKVWFSAFYYNPRAQRGPASTPVSTNLPGGAALAA